MKMKMECNSQQHVVGTRNVPVGSISGLRAAPPNSVLPLFFLCCRLHIKYLTETPIISREETAELVDVARAETRVNLEAIITSKVQEVPVSVLHARIVACISGTFCQGSDNTAMFIFSS